MLKNYKSTFQCQRQCVTAVVDSSLALNSNKSNPEFQHVESYDLRKQLNSIPLIIFSTYFYHRMH